MPLGFQRLNERTQRPNGNINFIKALDGPDRAVAQDFLERIAAQCYPIMKEHYLGVMTLEEYEPNPEFLGRNFNAGECIQLVLKDKSGRWLSFKFVQMVMMHELAHCKQMNHSRFFWAVRNGYAKQMEELWGKGYEGEGMWGRGKNLATGDFVHDHMPENAEIPEHLCGGTYRRRGRKRKRGQDDDAAGKPKVTYAERQQKRIAKKFGKHGEGTALGDDELVRGALDRAFGKRHTGKPRVAGSKRGRELRAAAALARFDAAKEQQAPEKTPELEDDDGSETEWSSDEDIDSSESILLRRRSGKIKDRNGNDLLQVCGDEGEENEGGQDEIDELRILSGKPANFPEKAPSTGTKFCSRLQELQSATPGDDSETESEPDDTASSAPKQQAPKRPTAEEDQDTATRQSTISKADPARPPKAVPPTQKTSPATTATSGMVTCPICSLENDATSATCMACAHVLKTSLMKNHWRCRSEACQGSKYINAGDVGRCGLCGTQKPATASGSKNERPVGVISGDVLRWD